MLYPQTNAFRNQVSLNGLWDFDIDPENRGESQGFPNAPELNRTIAVPGSWNEQFSDLHDYLQAAWYRRQVFVDRLDESKRAFLRIGAACNHCQAWVNGGLVGEYRLGYLPACFDVTEALQAGDNQIVIKVDSILTDKTLPTSAFDRGHWAGFEMAADYFPYCGIHRDVNLLILPKDGLENLKADTSLGETTADLQVQVWLRGQVAAVRTILCDGSHEVATMSTPVANKADHASLHLTVTDPSLWSPGSPHLYDLRVECLDAEGAVCDRYVQPVGLRTIEVGGMGLLLNGQPFTIRGFSRHEDFPIIGRGHCDAVMVRDFELMKWIGANAFRTSHYPYDERQYQMADRMGILVIDEAPVVSLFFPKKGQTPESMISQEQRALHRQAITDMMQRDWNHPSLIAWSVANECNGSTEATSLYFKEMVELAKGLDPTRAVLHTNCGGMPDPSHKWCDLVCVNYYDFPHDKPGRDVEMVRKNLSANLDQIHQQFGKPVLLSEFGMCAIPGRHSLSPLYFTEEGMVDHIMRYLDVAAEKDYLCGVLIWLLQDFKAQEGPGRPTENFKGVFDRLRQPKLMAHLLKRRWDRQ
jgi:beta-glucuronidase